MTRTRSLLGLLALAALLWAPLSQAADVRISARSTLADVVDSASFGDTLSGLWARLTGG